MIQIERRRFELDYFIMILMVVGILAVGFAIHLILARQISSYRQQLALLSQIDAGPAAQSQVGPVIGVAWSDWLSQYSAEFPHFVRLNKISSTTQGSNKIILELEGQIAQDASRARRNLVKMGLCKDVELKNVSETEQVITFQLECNLL